MDTEHEEIHKKLDKIIAMLEEHIKDRPFKDSSNHPLTC